MRRDIVWERLDRSGLEHLVLDIDAGGIRAESLVLLDDEAGPIALRYRPEMTNDWRTRAASFDLTQGGAHRRLGIARDAAGWKVDGVVRADLAGADDIDISATPLTNTPAIRQLALSAEETRPFRVVYVKVPALTVSPMSQDYTRLDSAEPARRYRYASPGFTAEVAFDADGIVEDYPPGWKRRTP